MPTATDRSDSSSGATGSRHDRNMGFRKVRDAFFYALFLSSILVGIGALIVLLTDVFIDGFRFLDLDFLRNFPSRHADQSGIRAGLIGSLWVISLTAAFTIPLASQQGYPEKPNLRRIANRQVLGR